MELPLFPLNTVLFPGEELPLHIFEPRYRQMIGECVEQERPFGVVLIESGPEVGGDAEPRRIGVTALVTKVERLQDGRMNIITVGGQRFRILDTSRHQPYLTGTVELLADEDDASGPAMQRAQQVRDLFLRFFQLTLALEGSWTRRVATPQRPGRLADFIAARLPVETATKQTLLEELDVPARLAAVARLLERGIEALEPRVVGAYKRRYGAFSALN